MLPVSGAFNAKRMREAIATVPHNARLVHHDMFISNARRTKGGMSHSDALHTYSTFKKQHNVHITYSKEQIEHNTHQFTDDISSSSATGCKRDRFILSAI